jgi:hypothetical protein
VAVPVGSHRPDALQVRRPELPGPVPEPDPPPGAGRVLDARGHHPGARPPAPVPGVRPARAVAQAPDQGPVLQAGAGTGPVRDPRRGLHGLLVLRGLLPVEADLRRAHHPALGRQARRPARSFAASSSWPTPSLGGSPRSGGRCDSAWSVGGAWRPPP